MPDPVSTDPAYDLVPANGDPFAMPAAVAAPTQSVPPDVGFVPVDNDPFAGTPGRYDYAHHQIDIKPYRASPDDVAMTPDSTTVVDKTNTQSDASTAAPMVSDEDIGRAQIAKDTAPREGGLLQTIPQFYNLLQTPEGRSKLAAAAGNVLVGAPTQTDTGLKPGSGLAVNALGSAAETAKGPAEAIAGDLTPEQQADWGANTAMMMVGAGTPFAETGAAGVAGGKLLPVRGPVESTPGYVYHATNAERAADIADNGLTLAKPGDFTDQDVWPDGSTEKRNYFTPTAQNAWQFAPEDGTPVLLRVPDDAHPFKTESTGDVYSTKNVPASKIEALTENGWQPLSTPTAEPLNLYRGEYSGNRGGNFYTTDPEWARQFSQSGQDKEILQRQIDTKHVFDPSTPVYAGDSDAVDAAIVAAKNAGAKAVRLDEGVGQPQSIYVFDKSALNRGPQSGVVFGSGSTDKELSAALTGLNTAQEVAPPLYSAVAKAVDDAKINKAPASQWLGTLKNMPGVKQEELDWIGLPQFLQEQKGPITKQQVADYVRQNQVQVNEVRKGGPSNRSLDEIANEAWGHNYDDLNPTQQSYVQGELFNPSNRTQTKFGQYIKNKGQSYGETLLTLPDMSPDMVRPSESVMAKYKSQWDEITNEINKMRSDLQTPDLIPNSVFARATRARLNQLEAEQDALHAKSVAETIAESNGRLGGDQFKGPHWDEPNVLANVLHSDKMIGGKKYLDLHELQSDWAQRGNAEGFRPDQEAKMATLVKERDAVGKEIEDSAGEKTQEETGALIDRMNELHDQIRELGSKNVGPPAMPMSKTWHELALKQMIRRAAEQGYDGVIVDNGETVAGRYDLSKHIDRIGYTKRADGTYDLAADKGSNTVLHEDGIDLKRISEIVGKEIAKKIENHEGKVYDRHGGHETAELTGLDLKVGGEFHKKLYDEKIPQALNKIGKKYGAKVEDATVGADEAERTRLSQERQKSWRALQPLLKAQDNLGFETVGEAGAAIRQNQDFAERWEMPKEVEDAANHYRSAADAASKAKNVSQETVHKLDITPALRKAAISQGFPMFKKGGRVQAYGESVRAAYRARGGRVEARNINHEPTPGQKSANNYAHDKIHVIGLTISIENAKGSYRRGVDKTGKEWRVKMNHPYGYFLGTQARDGDHVDCFVGPHRKSPHVFVIDQINHETGKYDEPKIMLFFASERQARIAYERGFSDGHGKDRIGKVTTTTIPQFKEWLDRGNTKQPFRHPHVKLESEKAAHAAVDYVAVSKKSDQRCVICKHFLPPKECEGVQSPISPRGWCELFGLKPGLQ